MSIAPAIAPAPAIGTPGAVGYVDPFAATPQPDNGSTGKALLVTSSPARTATANNITKLNQITSPAPAAPAPVNPTDTQLGNRGMGGMYNYKGADGNTISVGDPTLNRSQLTGATYISGPTGKEADPLASATPTNDTGGNKAAPDQYEAAVQGISDPGIAAQYKSTLQTLDKGIADAKSNLDNVKANSQNDPAANAIVDAVKARFEQQIGLMKAKNEIVLGRARTSVAAFGGLGQMSQDFLNDEQNKADARITDLQNKEQDAVIKAQIAYQTGNAKLLNDAMTQYENANKDKLTALNQLLTASNKQVTQLQAQQKIDAAAEKQAVTLDISKSANLGSAIVKNIADSGITDQAQIDQYVEGIAQEYGISNPDILKSAVEKARQALMKTDASVANTLDTIGNRDTKTKLAIDKANQPKKGSTKGAGTDGGYKYTGEDVDTYKGFLAQGGTGPDGTQYTAQDKDGYSDVGAYTAALKDWTNNKGTVAGFASKFPPKKYVNPIHYDQLPAAIRPTSAAAPLYSTK